ncbi:MAG: hypothetical protein NDJ75_09330 [Thermoanaerobaculia bacterium]|nr:hypothetical protein [Thermoanaerobaculia bacterium]
MNPALRAVLAALARRQPRRISAMLRVRNEEEFLAPAVRSIAPLVDELVLIDNRSDDRTPEIARQLAEEWPGKLVRLDYPHTIRRVGAETRQLAESPAGAASPELSANYYDWCRRQLRHPFAFKWDADMVALPELAATLAEWRRSRALVLVLRGANVHADRRHQAASRSSDHAALAARLASPGLPRWAAALGYDAPEPRLFPRRFARYSPRIGWTQTLDSPFYGRGVPDDLCRREEAPRYLHLKFCKRQPFAGYTPDLAQVIADNLTPGPPLPPAWLAVLDHHRLAAGAPA